MNWRTSGRTLLLALAVTSLSTSAWAQVELTFRFNDAEQDEMRAALDVFEKENPDIKVTLERVAWADAREQFLREAAVGEGPDVVHIAQVWTRSMGDAGVFIPLNDMIEEHGLGAGWDDFISADLASQDDGTIHAVPWTVDTFAMVYRKDILEQAGISQFPTTWEELRDASAQIKERTGATGWAFPAGSAATNSIWFFLNFYWWSHGWSLVDRAPDGKYVMGITPEQMAEGFSYYKSYFDQDLNPKAMLAVTNWGAQELIEGMVRGDIAIISTPEFVLNQIEAAWSARYPDQPNPFASTIHPKQSITFVGGRMLGINANTEHPEEAYRLVQYLISWPIFADYYPQWPAQTSLIGRIERGPSHAGYSEQLLKARSWGAYSTGPVDIPTMWNWVGRGAGAVFIGEKTPLEASQEIYDNISAKLAEQ
ncbi:MAG TPA: extracellular solute-binding protein [Geminicoccaceae bacterium]|nr:extracellular solute-binding protein [Geminicoccaceae bacterium]